MQWERYKDMGVAHMGVKIQINNKSTKQRLIDLIYGGLINRWTTQYFWIVSCLWSNGLKVFNWHFHGLTWLWKKWRYHKGKRNCRSKNKQNYCQKEKDKHWSTRQYTEK